MTAATNNLPLKVPFKEKDEAKSLGARWNPEGKHWYVPEGVDAAPFEKWLDGAPATMAQPQATQPKPAAYAAKPAKSENPLSADADMDDINAMLRDAYEVNDD